MRILELGNIGRIRRPTDISIMSLLLAHERPHLDTNLSECRARRQTIHLAQPEIKIEQCKQSDHKLHVLNAHGDPFAPLRRPMQRRAPHVPGASSRAVAHRGEQAQSPRKRFAETANPARARLLWYKPAMETKTPSPRTLILVPLDFEDASKKALDMALELAAPLNADIVALHITRPAVARPGELPASLLERLRDEAHAAAERELEQLVTRIANLKTLLRTGDPEDVILSAIDDLKPSLVIMGTHGRRGLRRLLLGSVAEHVLVRSQVPVITVRANYPA